METLTIIYCEDNVKLRAKEFNKKHELNKGMGSFAKVYIFPPRA